MRKNRTTPSKESGLGSLHHTQEDLCTIRNVLQYPDMVCNAINRRTEQDQQKQIAEKIAEPVSMTLAGAQVSILSTPRTHARYSFLHTHNTTTAHPILG